MGIATVGGCIAAAFPACMAWRAMKCWSMAVCISRDISGKGNVAGVLSGCMGTSGGTTATAGGCMGTTGVSNRGVDTTGRVGDALTGCPVPVGCTWGSGATDVPSGGSVIVSLVE